jgi:predicted small secreted protein
MKKALLFKITWEYLHMLIRILSTLCLVMFLAGCNTMEGVGKDMEAAGDAIEDSASENKNY